VAISCFLKPAAIRSKMPHTPAMPWPDQVENLSTPQWQRQYGECIRRSTSRSKRLKDRECIHSQNEQSCRVLEDRQAVDGFSGDRTEMKNLPLSKVYQLLEPGPVVLLTTTRKDHANIMAMSWHMMVDFEPPLVACIVTLLSKIAFSAN